MLIEKLSITAQAATERAGRLAVKSGHRHVSPTHMLVAILESKDDLVTKSLKASHAEGARLLELATLRLRSVPLAERGADDTPITRALESVLIRADEAAASLANKYIGPSHVLLGLCEDEGVGADLVASGCVLDELRTLLRAPRSSGKTGARVADLESLSKYGVDLTERARDGKIDPVIGRDQEIRQMIQILTRRLKNNPVLVGEPGVGKTAVVEALAQRIADGRVPDDLATCSVVTLDLGTMVAGTKFRGEFEERFKRVLAEASETEGIILFIDELHTLMGAGAAEGSMDASNLLKPALARGEIRCIGSTTLNEYRKHIEKDAALTRRFQLVMVDEPTVEQAITILRGLKPTYEAHHGLRITDPAIHAAVKLSHRYLTDRFLPDKAIDLVDQAAAGVRMEAAARPEEIERLDERIVGLEIEVSAIEQDHAGESTEASRRARTEVEELKEKRGVMLERWETEKRAVFGVKEAKRDLEAAKREMETKIREEDFARVAELQYKVIPDRERRLAELGEVSIDEARYVRTEVTERDVAETIAKATRIPVAKLLDEEAARLLQMEEIIGARVRGQLEAVGCVSRAVRRSRAAVQDPNRPLGSFLFLGPTGVGKTELAKALTEFLFDDERALVRVDMSEYMEKHSASKLVGSPPGYVGYEDGGVLTNHVRRRPYSVILFDEVEKAHPDVFHILLQLLDEGRLTDGHGATVNFRNVVVVLTSNLGSSEASGLDAEKGSKVTIEAARRFFRPELLNRLDDLLVFRPLDRDTMLPITELQIGIVARLVADRGVTLTVSKGALDYLADKGFDPLYGARPLKRTIQREVQDPIADLLLGSKVTAGGSLHVTRGDAGLTFELS